MRLALSLPLFTNPPTGLETSDEGKNISMAQETDFYSADEAAKVLGMPVGQIFGMLCRGELEGYQDVWARWRVSASAVQAALRSSEPSSELDGLPKDEAKPLPAEEETRVLDAEATTVRSDGGLLSEPSDGSGLPSGEGTTQEAGETPVSGASASSIHTESSDVETTESLPNADNLNPDVAPNETVRDLAERLAMAAAKTRELRDRLELAEFAETTLRESLKRERERANAQNVRMEQQRGAIGQREEEQIASRGEGIWRRFLGG